PRVRWTARGSWLHSLGPGVAHGVFQLRLAPGLHRDYELDLAGGAAHRLDGGRDQLPVAPAWQRLDHADRRVAVAAIAELDPERFGDGPAGPVDAEPGRLALGPEVEGARQLQPQFAALGGVGEHRLADQVVALEHAHPAFGQGASESGFRGVLEGDHGGDRQLSGAAVEAGFDDGAGRLPVVRARVDHVVTLAGDGGLRRKQRDPLDGAAGDPDRFRQHVGVVLAG